MKVVNLEIGEGKDRKAYPICFSSNALYRLQKESGLTVATLGMMLMAGQAGFMELQLMLWAGLEGGRLRLKYRRSEYSVDEAGDLIDVAGGAVAFWSDDSVYLKKMLEAWESAFPKPRADAPKDEPKGDGDTDPQAESTSSDSPTLPSTSA